MRAPAAAITLGAVAAIAAGCSSTAGVGAITNYSAQTVQQMVSSALPDANCDVGARAQSASTSQGMPFYSTGTLLQAVQCDNGVAAFVSPDGRRPTVPGRLGNLQPFAVGTNYVITAASGDDADFLTWMCSIKKTATASVTVYELNPVTRDGGYYGVPERAAC